MAAAFDLDRLVADHEWSRLVVDVDEESVGLLRRREKLFYRRPQRLVVATDDEHRRCFTAVLRGPNDDMAQQVRAHAASEKVIAKSERDSIAAIVMDRTFLDRDHALRPEREMPHDEVLAPR